ncbi:hypothetical protein M422DRAFT_260618 [Sphaerobolus stellatus SS14]|uniref:Uncharacterized protein n=1 Tax=Sphaerobolus stellatus (strain SS14) TaxID=990650 RepID=A0A0C9V5Y4_SPHS4|nr:hypothetical protein M422DRAFT_260618 [Sphaerobolus stellatus SS14]
MSDPVKLFQIQSEILQSRQQRTGHIVHAHQQMKIIHLCNSRSDLKRFKHSFIIPIDITRKRPIRFLATIDDGAGLCVIDSHIWGQWQKDFGNAIESIVGAKVGSGHILKSRGYIILHVNVEGVVCDTVFEILDSQGAFEILLGKPWLGLTRATREYDKDTLVIHVGPVKIVIPNRSPKLPLAYKNSQTIQIKPARSPDLRTPPLATNTTSNQLPPAQPINSPRPRLAPTPLKFPIARPPTSPLLDPNPTQP